MKEVIAYVDGETSTISSAYSEADIARVREARNIRFSNANLHYAFAPVYCNAKGLVKKFVAFMGTDKAIKLYKENVAGGLLPFKYDYTAMNLQGVESETAHYISQATLIYNTGNTKLSVVGGLGVFQGSSDALMDYVFACDPTNKFYKTPEDFYKGGFKSDSDWSYMLSLCS